MPTQPTQTISLETPEELQARYDTMYKSDLEHIVKGLGPQTKAQFDKLLGMCTTEDGANRALVLELGHAGGAKDRVYNEIRAAATVMDREVRAHEYLPKDASFLTKAITSIGVVRPLDGFIQPDEVRDYNAANNKNYVIPSSYPQGVKPELLATINFGQTMKAMEGFDTDKDGKISMQEITSGLEGWRSHSATQSTAAHELSR